MTDTTQNQVRREIQTSINPWLRFQVGIAEKRKALAPVYVGNQLVNHRVKDDEWVWTFRLIGWGKTLRMAEEMASKT